MVDISVLTEFKPQHEFFIGIDSDGAVFDTMEIKHKECFIPNIIKYFKLQAVSKYARAAGEFVNLYSKWRGVNRFPALVKTCDLLEDWDEVQRREVEIPPLTALRAWVERESRLGNPALEQEAEKTNDDELRLVLEYSKAVNAAIADMVEGVAPFPFVRDSLEQARDRADMFVISQTPVEALTREWEEHSIDHYVHVICGQEYGTKTEHLKYAAGDKYGENKVLMIGDAPGDRRAAEANSALFFPIMPGHEEASWKRFHEEALDRFFTGNYAGAYQQQLVEEFEAALPEQPPWKR